MTTIIVSQLCTWLDVSRKLQGASMAPVSVHLFPYPFHSSTHTLPSFCPPRLSLSLSRSQRFSSLASSRYHPLRLASTRSRFLSPSRETSPLSPPRFRVNHAHTRSTLRLSLGAHETLGLPETRDTRRDYGTTNSKFHCLDIIAAPTFQTNSTLWGITHR